MIACTAGTLTHPRPRWCGWASALTALVTLVRGGALKRSGFYAPGGGYGTLTFIVILI